MVSKVRGQLQSGPTVSKPRGTSVQGPRAPRNGRFRRPSHRSFFVDSGTSVNTTKVLASCESDSGRASFSFTTTERERITAKAYTV